MKQFFSFFFMCIIFKLKCQIVEREKFLMHSVDSNSVFDILLTDYINSSQQGDSIILGLIMPHCFEHTRDTISDLIGPDKVLYDILLLHSKFPKRDLTNLLSFKYYNYYMTFKGYYVYVFSQSFILNFCNEEITNDMYLLHLNDNGGDTIDVPRTYIIGGDWITVAEYYTLPDTPNNIYLHR